MDEEYPQDIVTCPDCDSDNVLMTDSEGETGGSAEYWCYECHEYFMVG